MSLDRLIERIDTLKNPTVIGLDPLLEHLPTCVKEEAFARHGRTLEGAADAILTFNKALIDVICGIVPAVKPQLAYFELYGVPGITAFYETVSYAKAKGMFVIADGKRNDIASTMTAYATAHLGVTDIEGESAAAFGSDALTVNGYLGSDGITPLLDVCNRHDKGIFVLAKTSNPSSGELQDKLIDGIPLYEHMGELCEKWGEALPGKHGYSGVGAVVGATYPEQLKALRQKLKRTFFLVPGYGAQGGGADEVRFAFDSAGGGAIVNSSRAVMCAYKKGYDEKDYAKAAYDEVIRMREALR